MTANQLRAIANFIDQVHEASQNAGVFIGNAEVAIYEASDVAELIGWVTIDHEGTITLLKVAS